ncbi:MAG: hypothetical protein WCA56_06600 [Xanthobacteraceae bacterium]
MKTLLTVYKSMPMVLAFLGLAIAGSAPAAAQSLEHTGSVLPYYYTGTGAQMRGSWAPQVPEAVPHRAAPSSSRPLYMYAPHGLKHR